MLDKVRGRSRRTARQIVVALVKLKFSSPMPVTAQPTANLIFKILQLTRMESPIIANKAHGDGTYKNMKLNGGSSSEARL